MTDRRALVSGASIAGLSTAFWLARAGWDVTVIERAEAFRDGGQNVDVRGTARDVVERMGLTQAVREDTTTEEGTRFVDADGDTIGEFPQEGHDDGPTAELEILRGDLARIILDALPQKVEVRFGESIDTVDDDRVRLVSGDAVEADLVVIAEGVRSATRDLVFGDAVDRHELGLTMAYGTIDRSPDDDRWWNWFTATGSRQVTLRPDQKGTTRATLAYLSDDDLSDADRADAVARLREVFDGAGWVTPRVLDGFEASDDVYIDQLTQIRMPRWSEGRIVVTGDAAWCVTPLGGGGSSLALIGGYVLAAFASQLDVPAALARYEGWMRPLVADTQDLPPGTPRLAYPRSRVGVELLKTVVRVVSSEPAKAIAGRFSEVAESQHELPELRRAE